MLLVAVELLQVVTVHILPEALVEARLVLARKEAQQAVLNLMVMLLAREILALVEDITVVMAQLMEVLAVLDGSMAFPI